MNDNWKQKRGKIFKEATQGSTFTAQPALRLDREINFYLVLYQFYILLFDSNSSIQSSFPLQITSSRWVTCPSACFHGR